MMTFFPELEEDLPAEAKAFFWEDSATFLEMHTIPSSELSEPSSPVSSISAGDSQSVKIRGGAISIFSHFAANA
jgi:hypothetical protein